MTYNEKLRLFFKSSGLSQKEVSERLLVSPSMLSRYFKGSDNFSSEFIFKLVKEFPNIDLQYIFSDDNEKSEINEPQVKYSNEPLDVISELEIIEKKIVLIKESLARKSHAK
ncbi:MAG: helix-turn-helix domain-containing protein [Flavobacteriaceae bacterium]|nr:helix-turn-helix domain-containing protein [Flavobacteriaceae bacterium]